MSKKKRNGIIIAVVVAVILMIIGGAGGSGNTKQDKIKEIKDNYSVNEKLATSIYNASEKIGMHAEKYTSDQVVKSGKMNILVPVTDYTNVMITHQGNKVTRIMTDGGNVVYTEDSHKKLSNYTVKPSLYSDVYVAAKSAVKDQLKAPDTAKFKDDFKVYRNGKKITFSGSVSAQNSFGAQLTTSFTGSAKKDGDDYKVTNCTLVE